MDVRSDSREKSDPPPAPFPFPFLAGGFLPFSLVRIALVLGVLEGSEWIFGEFLRSLGEFERALVIFSEFW